MKSIIALLLFLACVPAARAGEGWTATDIVAARLVSAVTATGDGATVPLGLHLRLQPGWKTYWRSPGDAGQPPRLDWQGSANLAAADPGWPAPHRFSLFGLETFGYDGDIVLPIEARPTEPGKPLDLKAGLDLLVCSEICVPQHLDLTLAIPAGPALPGPDAPLIARAVARIPGDGAAAGLNLAGVAVGGTDAAPVLEVTATAREPFADPDAFIESDPPLALGAPERRFS